LTTTSASNTSAFLDALQAPGPLPELASRMGLYAPLIGRWDVDVVDYEDGGLVRRSRGEWLFSWVLEGRAIQDVFIVPTRGARNGAPGKGNRYGATLRVYDPGADTWRVTWTNAVTNVQTCLTGSRRGEEIFQEGSQEDGSLVRWVFSDMNPDSFRWTGLASTDGGATWRKQVEFFARRV
jgi:hypothetical protein